MPLLRFGEQRLDPDLALAHRLGIRLRRVVAAYAIEVRFVDAAADPSSAWRRRALVAERTIPASRCRRLVDPPMGRLALSKKAQDRAAEAVIDVGGRVIREVLVAQHPRPLPHP